MKIKQYVARTNELGPGQGKKIKVGKLQIALFNYRGKYFALQNYCPHQNADLADGYIRDGQLYCPMHHWAFDLFNGAYAFNPELKIKTYPVLVEQESIYIMLD